MITLIQADKSGSDVFEKDYSVIVVLNKKDVFGINLPQKIKDDLMSKLKKNELGIKAPSEKTAKNRLRIRLHTTAIILLIKQALKNNHAEDVNIEVCNDLDGHFHEMKDMLFKNLVKIIVNLRPEDIVLSKFQKPSLIDEAGKAFRNNDIEQLKKFNKVKLDEKELLKIIKK